MHSASSNSVASPRNQLKINLSEKLNTKIKNDLKQLDKIKLDSIRLRSPKLPGIKAKLPNKIELNIDLNSKSSLKPINTSEITQSDLQKQIPTHKYPFNKDEIVSINELRSRVYHGTMGVVPVRKSQDINDLKFVMKGKPLIKSNQVESLIEYEDDEGINEPNSSEDEDFLLRSNLNTPNSTYNYESINQQELNTSKEEYLQRTYQSYLNEIKNQQYNRPRPAILPTTGTSGLARMVERPKPARKPKTVLKKIKKLSEKDSSEDLMLDPEQQMSETELQQLNLESQVKDLVDEARKIAKVNDAKDKFHAKRKKQAPQTELLFKDDPDFDLDTLNQSGNNEKKLLKSVEGLISAIKSGQLIIEQEQSNKRIQEILGSVLDKASLSLFDPSFSERDPIIEEAAESVIDTQQLNDSQTSSILLATEQSYKEKDSSEKHSHSNATVYNDQKSLPGSILSSLHKRSREGDNLSTSQTEKLSDTARSLLDTYQDEIDQYLASLPSKATNEDVLNTTAVKATLFDRESHKQERGPKPVVEPTTEEIFARNLHLFCMLEHERRDYLLLPEELADVTRKFHTRNKFESRKTAVTLSTASLATAASSKSKLKESILIQNRTSEAAQRVFDNLTDMMSFERKKSSYTRTEDDLVSLTNDSGLGDDLDSWRQQAENVINDKFILEARKANINLVDNMTEFALTFLKPAPPKMSVRPSRIRQHLFPKYKSLPPPVDDLNLLGKKSTSKKRLKSFYEASAENKEELDEDEDEDELVDDSDLEMQFILEKLLNREYHSMTDLDKFDTGTDQEETEIGQNEEGEEEEVVKPKKFLTEDEIIFGKKPKLIRTFSDTVIFRKKTHKTKYDLQFEDNLEEFDFAKIDSNYNDAMEEVINQKKKIKEDYLSKKRASQLTASQMSKQKSYKTPETDDEIKRIENKTSMSSNDQRTATNTGSHINDYFPKNNQKTLAELALESGRNYIINNSHKITRKTKKNKSKIQRFRKAKLGLELLDQIEEEIFSANIKKLKRAESTDKIEFKPKVYHPDDQKLYLAARNRNIRKPSVGDLSNFENYKEQKGFKNSRWFNETDSYYNKEREWTRDIWNVWFDEVIPKFKNGNEEEEEEDIVKKTETSTQGLSNTSSRLRTDSASNAQSSRENDAGETKQTEVEQIAMLTEPEEEDDEDDDDESGKKTKRVVKSPTPYAIYGEVQFDDSEEMQIDLKQVKLVEKEIEILTKRLELKSSVFDLVRRGTLYRKLGFIKKALEDLNIAIELEPKFVDAYWQRHLIYLVQDRKNDAMEDLNEIIKLKKNMPGHICQADLYAERNDLSMAIVNYSQVIKINDKDYQAYFKRAKMYELRGDTLMAMDDYLQTTRLNPKISEAWFKHGMSYYNNGNWHYAIVDFTEMIKYNPQNQAQARLYRGKCYLNLEDFQPAFDDFCVAIHLNPNDWESYFHRGCLLRKLDPMQALKDFSISLLLEDGYDNLKCYLHRGILYTDLERYDEAIKDFESVLQLDKEYAPAYVNLGIIYMNLTMNYWMAIKQFNLAIKANPVYIRAYLCRAQCYRLIHDLKSAYLDYTKAIHMDPMNTQIYIYRGQVIFEMGNLKLAAFCVQHASFLNDGLRSKSSMSGTVGTIVRSTSGKTKNYSEALTSHSNMTNLSVAPKQNQSVTQRALVFAFLKNYDKAISILESELRVKATTDIYNLLGRVYMKAKRWSDAVVAFDKSIELNFDESKMPNRSHNNNLSTTNQSYSKLANLTGMKASKKDLIDAYFMKGQCLLETKKYQDAYAAFDKVIDLKPTSAQAFYYRGITRVNLKHQKCIQDFNRALAIDPNLFEAFLARACIYGIQQRYTKAILNCNEAVKINSKSVRGYLYRGALKYLSRSFDYAVLDLTEAIKLDQTCVLAFFNRALCYQQMKQFKNSLKDFSIVIMLGDFLKFKVFINRGLLYFSMKNYLNALIDFKMAAEFEPTNYNIQHMIGVCLHKLERYDEAVDKLTETYHLNTSLQDALVSRGNVYVDYGHDHAFLLAQKDYEHVLNRDASNFNAHINLAYLFQITGRFKLAWQQFTKAIDVNPNFVPAYEGRSIVCLQMSDTFAALKDMNQAIKLKPTAELFVNRGVIHQFMADNINAMRDYQSAILMDSGYGLAYYNSANILLLHKQFDQAIKYLDIAIEKNEMKDESTYQNRAIAKALSGDTSGAFRDLCEAIKYGKYSAHIFMNRGILLYKMENFKLAQKDFNTAINLSPNDALLYKLRADCLGKLGFREDAIQDYKLAVDLQQRDELKKIYN